VGADEPDSLTVAVDPTMPIGALDVALDVRRFGENARARDLIALSERVPTIHLRTRLRGARWVGVLTHDARVASPEPPSEALAPMPSPRVEEASLVCLERLGRAVSEGLHAWARVDPAQRSVLRAAARAEAAEAASCARDPGLAEERDGWLEVLERIPE
jgi:hypothetical protein